MSAREFRQAKLKLDTTETEKTMKITYADVVKDEAVRTYIQKADQTLNALGYTEHSFAHVTKVAKLAADILLTLE